MTVSATVDTTTLASELRLVLGQLMRRLRAEHGFPLSQGAVLGRLDRSGPMSIGELAEAERVRPQSMGQTIQDLEADGLIARRCDEADRRRTIVDLTPEGRRVLAEERRRREGWLAEAIDQDLTVGERRLLLDAAQLLRRLAEG